MLIRFMEEKDITETYNLIKESFSAYQEEIDISFIKNNFHDPNNFSIIALIDDKIIGHINIDKVVDFVHSAYYYYLRDVCVSKLYRRQGIGESMLKKVEELAQEQQIKYITFTSSPDKIAAYHLYTKNNYITKDTKVFIKNI